MLPRAVELSPCVHVSAENSVTRQVTPSSEELRKPCSLCRATLIEIEGPLRHETAGRESRERILLADARGQSFNGELILAERNHIGDCASRTAGGNFCNENSIFISGHFFET